MKSVSGWRREEWWHRSFYLMVVYVIGAPLAVALAGRSLLDALRVFALAQASIVIVLYAHTLWHSYRRVRHVPYPDVSTRQLAIGNMTRMGASLLLLSDEVYDVANRIGAPNFNLRTPILLVSLWGLFVAWLWVDLRRWRALP